MMNAGIIYSIAILISIPISFIIDNIMNKKLNKINEERRKEIEIKLAHIESLQKELRKYKD